MSVLRLVIYVVGLTCAVAIAPLRLTAQQEKQSSTDLLNHALHLADLYNWAAAGPEFTRAEKMFTKAGDQRNALYAKV